jgi:coproporphyrinogen III oxidase
MLVNRGLCFKVHPFVNNVAEVKMEAPKAGNVMKACAVLNGFGATYSQAYCAVTTTKRRSDWSNSERGFQHIVPYRKKFDELNQNSVTTCGKFSHSSSVYG